MTRALPCLPLLGLLVGCTSSTPPVFTPSVTLRVTLPPDLRPAQVARLEVSLAGVSGDVPPVLVSTLGAIVRSIVPDGGGARQVEIRFDMNPFLGMQREIGLLPGPGAVTGPAAPPFTVRAVARRGDDVPIAEGTASQDSTGQPIRFAGDVRADVPLVCVLPGGCALDAGVPDAGTLDGGLDGGTDDGGPGPVTVAGQVIDREGRGIPGARLVVGAKALEADDGGVFTLPDVLPPFDLTVLPPGTGPAAAVSWMALTAPELRPALPTSLPDGGLRSATLRVRIFVDTGGKAEITVAGALYEQATLLPLVVKRQDRLTLQGPGSVLSNPITLTWVGPPTTEAVVATAITTPDDGGPGFRYVRFSVHRVPITQGVETEVNGDRNTFSGSDLVTVEARGASTLTERRFYPLLDVGGVQVSLPGAPDTGYSTGTFPVMRSRQLAEVCPSCAQFVRVAGRRSACTSRGSDLTYAIAHSEPLTADPDGGRVTVTLLDPPTVQRPAEVDPDAGTPDAGGVPATPATYELVAEGYTMHLAILARSERGAASHSLLSAATAGSFPDLRLIDAGLPAGNYTLIVVSTRDPTLTPERLATEGRPAIPFPTDFCTGSPPLGFPPGSAAGVAARVVELKP